MMRLAAFLPMTAFLPRSLGLLRDRSTTPVQFDEAHGNRARSARRKRGELARNSVFVFPSCHSEAASLRDIRLGTAYRSAPKNLCFAFFVLRDSSVAALPQNDTLRHSCATVCHSEAAFEPKNLVKQKTHSTPPHEKESP